ncbi:uncharacterized protein MELLADRAFT_101726 [Melampsora larici-populina 98AG31]|uniref:Uncharacterized protein n=1 Tax=Melampsora larici-populina (strain 98AG31 / pathotype 3-4-7) TaxID=747676 RepID=F4R6S1_MELLP|nr:uncharacterized protein MELLADRAFT_101726 [Melampsora larici-populina 98AG31]EGG12409.1 hypothetical protein MELLADRAFT_101726 [Melampsora larici-populina 98AG31]
MLLYIEIWNLSYVFSTLFCTHFGLVTGRFPNKDFEEGLSNDVTSTSNFIDYCPFIQHWEDSTRTSETGGLSTDTTRGVHEDIEISPHHQHEESKMEGNEMKMYNEEEVKLSNLLREFDSMNHLNFLPLPECIYKDIEDQFHPKDISNDPQTIKPQLRITTHNDQPQVPYTPDHIVSHVPNMEADDLISESRLNLSYLSNSMGEFVTKNPPIPAPEINGDLIRKQDEPKISQGIQPQSINQPETQKPVYNMWKKRKVRNLKSLLRIHNELDRYQEALVSNNLISSKQYIPNEQGLLNKRRKTSIEKDLGVVPSRYSNSYQAYDSYHDEDCGGTDTVFSSKESLWCVSNNTPSQKERIHFSNALGSGNDFKHNVVFTENRVFKGVVQQVHNVVPEAKRTYKQETAHEDTSIYRNQARTSFDHLIEKHVIPFMTELEEFFETGMDMSHRKYKSRPHLINRLRLMTHEFLLFLVKVNFTFDPEGKELNNTLLEGYKWLINIWKSIPIESYIYNHAPNFNQLHEAYNSTATVEETLISRVMGLNLFARSQHMFMAYLSINWIQRFRPKCSVATGPPLSEKGSSATQDHYVHQGAKRYILCSTVLDTYEQTLQETCTLDLIRIV